LSRLCSRLPSKRSRELVDGALEIGDLERHEVELAEPLLQPVDPPPRLDPSLVHGRFEPLQRGAELPVGFGAGLDAIDVEHRGAFLRLLGGEEVDSPLEVPEPGRKTGEAAAALLDGPRHPQHAAIQPVLVGGRRRQRHRSPARCPSL
jgi:hypothetical protein